ncbi:Disease resistance protein family [Perilla frutescens var. hirtella]|uniref:Disease resistance protein family n=1 Tax=Perilla frutescens var. hirtella TaxID=608512 RepID=A0AAD4J817_PERFH|nr:Disease resistance protein family [Perilla frutescens var. frutescens]KAH6794549.1 Disease resistance protein family [Perilla frutescens var. hirtella]KAH6828679.1 Disease resistance protein family [Perilla frutescens var. hirtella]
MQLVPSLPDGLNGAYNSVSEACGNLISLIAFSCRISWISLQGYLDLVDSGGHLDGNAKKF